jgi:hypothetical protein
MAESENGLKQIKAQIEQLPVEEKIRLVQDLLSGSGLQVVMGGGNFISAEIVLQIQSGSVEIERVLDAAANRIAKEKAKKNNSHES